MHEYTNARVATANARRANNDGLMSGVAKFTATIARQHAETAVATAGQVTAVAMRCESSRGDGDEVCGTDGKGKSSLVDALLVAAAVLSACHSES